MCNGLFLETYNKNRNALNNYRWWKETNAPLPEFHSIFRGIFADENGAYFFIDTNETVSRKYVIPFADINSIPYFMELDKPLLIKNVMSPYDLEYVYDNVRASDRYGEDNHIYAYYQSLEQFGLLASIMDFEKILDEEKLFFLIGKSNLEQNYPYDFKGRCGIDYSSIEAKPLRIDEIKRLVLDQPFSFYMGNVFFAGILDFHPNLLTMGMFGGVGFNYLYKKLFAGKNIAQCKKTAENSRSKYVAQEFLEMFQTVDDYNENLPGPDWNTFWEELRLMFGESVPSRYELYKGFFLAYNLGLKKEMNSRITPAIRATSHCVGAEVSHSENMKLFSDFKYMKSVHIIRNPCRAIAASMDNTLNLPKTRRPYGFFKWMLVAGPYRDDRDFYLANMWVSKNELSPAKKAVRFEDLKLHQKETLMQLCEFLDIPFSNTMLDTTFNGAPNGMMTGEHKISGFDTRAVTNLHEKAMSPFDYYRLEILWGRTMEAYGYSRDYYLDNKKYSLDEVLELFSRPFRFEQYLYTKRQREMAEVERKKILDSIRCWYKKECDNTEAGEQLLPIPLLYKGNTDSAGTES